MMRPLALRDMPLLNRYRKKGLYLDSIPMLTGGPIVVSRGAMLSALSALTGVFTVINERRDEAALIGQVVHHQAAAFAHLSFLAPIDQLRSIDFAELLDQLIVQVSERGAHSIIAELEESGPAFEALREAGFSIYARQGIWRLNQGIKTELSKKRWRPAEALDAIAVRSLCGALVPGMIRQAEGMPWDRMSGMVHYEQGELRAYVDVRSGSRGIWMQPFVHFDAQSFNISFKQMVNELTPRRKRPLYVCIRSYQDQLDNLLMEMGAEIGPRQAMMVKRTDVHVKTQQRQAIIERNGRSAEASAPIRVPVQQAAFDMEVKEYD